MKKEIKDLGAWGTLALLRAKQIRKEGNAKEIGGVKGTAQLIGETRTEQGLNEGSKADISESLFRARRISLPSSSHPTKQHQKGNLHGCNNSTFPITEFQTHKVVAHMTHNP
ncbi:hypothetical protein TIFTF001_028300 [Ficus carica]|uniref:Uncharacterized protein n=1 Tax=Ficus carica TaxID=3494 RepID=A0AA88J1A5_FICCA|nr:hypothetical protein TIFTF001_028300 [Ficus carica]